MTQTTTSEPTLADISRALKNAAAAGDSAAAQRLATFLERRTVERRDALLSRLALVRRKARYYLA